MGNKNDVPAQEERRYYIDDPETGLPYRVSEYVYNAYQQMVRSTSIKLRKELIGTVMICGTASELKGEIRFQDLWNESKSSVL